MQHPSLQLTTPPSRLGSVRSVRSNRTARRSVYDASLPVPWESWSAPSAMPWEGPEGPESAPPPMPWDGSEPAPPTQDKVEPEDQHTQAPAESLHTVDEKEAEWLTGVPLMMLMVAMSLVMFLVLLDSSIIGTAVPRITSDFRSLGDVGWYGSAFQLTTAVVQPLAGKIYTAVDQKWTFMSFFAIFEIGSLLCGVATSSNMLIVGRAIAGIGVAGLQNGALIIVASAAPLTRRATLNGILLGLSQLGIVMGPLIGGAFTSYSTWRWCFYINLPAGVLVAGCLVFVRIPKHKAPVSESGKTESKFMSLLKDLDLFGFVLFTGFAIQFLLALQWGGDTYDWDSATIVSLFWSTGVTLALFLVWQYHKGDAAMIPFSIAGKTVVWSACIVYGILMAALFLLTYYLPLYFQAVKNAEAIMSGVYTLPNIISQLATSVISGVLVERLGYYLPWSVASIIITSIGTGLMTTFHVDTSTGEWIGYQIIFGAGCGMGIQMPILAAQNSLPDADIPIAVALLIFSQSMISAVWLAIADTIFNSNLETLIVEYAPNLDVEAVLAAGAAGVRTVVTDSADLFQVLRAYSAAVDKTFYIAAGSLAASILFVWGTGWKDIRRKEGDGPQQSMMMVA